jgi:hypothetical protein
MEAKPDVVVRWKRDLDSVRSLNIADWDCASCGGRRKGSRKKSKHFTLVITGIWSSKIKAIFYIPGIVNHKSSDRQSLSRNYRISALLGLKEVD